MNKEDITKLADLARIEVTDKETTELIGDFKSILSYVDQIQSVDISDIDIRYDDENTFRDDVDLNANEETIRLIRQSFPERENGFLKVNSIIKNDD